ncbi:A/G-specific adenine glycosylase [Lutibacter sp.]|uniref:A/G-specific adenine glycosylase n=1 Tax=Lutibacter sp. TaxID=1925666 RepID=UPI001A1F5564|nr:A/G-specific adenine glycosylase [Lutibacter sp.]MBI9040320.1 A/G-specific adenine glycosylase [Lutibacter sp.]
MKFSNTLVQWYLQNKRDLPWRKTNDPYIIWLSEIILQQTRVDQGMAYFLKFMEHFPTVFHLAKASEEEVLKLWQGLGYYSRARNLHFSAKSIVNDFGGDFPATYNGILKLKGVGDYTASAIASICYNEPTAVVDGNVYRVLARYFGINTPINSTKGIKEFKLLAQKLLNTSISGTHNQAVMEFGARMCKPQNPDCEVCPLNSSCISLAKNLIKALPVKEKKLKVKNRYFNYLVVQSSDNKTIIEKRTQGIWVNLYQFPLLESKQEIAINQLIEHNKFNELFGELNVSVKLFNQTMVVHKLSHQHIFTKFWIISVPSSVKFSFNWDEIERFPVPILIDNFLNEYKSN